MKFTVHIVHPFSLEKTYGVELNKFMSLIPDQDYAAIVDWDSMFLDHKQIPLLYDYIEKYPDTGLFLARSNRSGSPIQRYNGMISNQMSMSYWHRIAMNIKPKLSVTDVLDNKISGFLMLISKQTWNEIKFNEELQVLHVDRDYAGRILAAGKPIRVMDDVLIYHSYRVWGRNTNHLV